jgi:hypothetical protein
MSIVVEKEICGEDLSGDIPCGAYFRLRLCGLPSVARILFTCACGLTWRGFTCARCLADLRSGTYWCLRCRKAQAVITSC